MRVEENPIPRSFEYYKYRRWKNLAKSIENIRKQSDKLELKFIFFCFVQNCVLCHLNVGAIKAKINLINWLQQNVSLDLSISQRQSVQCRCRLRRHFGEWTLELTKYIRHGNRTKKKKIVTQLIWHRMVRILEKKKYNMDRDPLLDYIMWRRTWFQTIMPNMKKTIFIQCVEMKSEWKIQLKFGNVEHIKFIYEEYSFSPSARNQWY